MNYTGNKKSHKPGVRYIQQPDFLKLTNKKEDLT